MKTFRIVSIVMIIAMIAGLGGSGVLRAGGQPAAARPERIAVGAMPMNGVHMVPPSKAGLDVALANEGLPLNATQEQRLTAEKTWFEKFQKQSDTWVNPAFQEYVNEREKQLSGAPNALDARGVNDTAAVPVTATVYAMAVDFGATETFNIPVDDGTGACVVTPTTIVGPRVGHVPAPEADDNFTLWYTPAQVSDAKFYEKIIFGYEGAGRVRMDMTDPDDGQPGINLTGFTVQDYYDNVAGEGNVQIEGTVEGWVTVPYSEGHYGADNCATGSHGGGAGVPVAQLVIDAIDEFQDAHPTYWTDPNYWPQYDANNDGILDTFWIIHAGMGQEAGGGEEGTFSIWAHSSDLRYYFPQMPNGYQVYEGDANTDADDIYVGPYTMQPEMAETGVFAEEFGHNFFGLPDLYVNDANNSIGMWAIMSGGAWNGYLGGTVPASMPLWFKMIAAAFVGDDYVPLNWHQPMVTRAYDAAEAEVEIGQLEKTEADVNKGVRVSLPPVVESIANYAGDGPGAYSGTGRDGVDITLTKRLAIPASADGVLTFDSYWEIEDGWDYGYLMVGSDLLHDTTGYFTDENPEGNNLGWGLTGFGEDTLQFDLSAYAGQTVDLTFRYKTDAAATEAGWWIDHLMLDGVIVDDFSAASGSGTFPGWTNSEPGWLTVPTEVSHTQYYLVEWRSKTKYDRMTKTAYVFNDDDTVSRVPYNIPAAVLYYRNTKYSNTYAQRPNYSDEPSFGSKYQLLIVDQNWKPVRLFRSGTTTYQSYLTGRVSAYDAGLTLQPSEAFTIPSVNGLANYGPYTIAAKPAVTHFNDALGYYAGFYYGAPCSAGSICYAERDGSVVIPARGPYSVRITNFNFAPFLGLYGASFSPTWLGSGNPAEDNVQYGVNIDLLSKTGDDAYHSRATLRFYNYSVDFLGEVTSYRAATDGIHASYQFNVQNVGTEDASDLFLEWYPDAGQQIVSLDVSGPDDMAYTQGTPTRDTTVDGLMLEFPSLPAGQEIVVTVDTFTPVELTSGDGYGLYTEMWAGDGQIERGPYWYDLEGEANFLFFPYLVQVGGN